MYEFGEKHPIGFEIILIIVSFLAAGVIVMACSIVNIHPDLSSSIARVFVALVLLVIYRRAFKGQNPFTNPVIVIPSLLFAVWNVFYNLSSGMVFGGSVFFIEAGGFSFTISRKRAAAISAACSSQRLCSLLCILRTWSGRVLPQLRCRRAIPSWSVWPWRRYICGTTVLCRWSLCIS